MFSLNFQLDRAHDQIVVPLEEFRKDAIGGVKEKKKQHEKRTAKFCQAQEKILNLSSKKPETVVVEVTNTFYAFQKKKKIQQILHPPSDTIIKEFLKKGCECWTTIECCCTKTEHFHTKETAHVHVFFYVFIEVKFIIVCEICNKKNSSMNFLFPITDFSAACKPIFINGIFVQC